MKGTMREMQSSGTFHLLRNTNIRDLFYEL